MFSFLINVTTLQLRGRTHPCALPRLLLLAGGKLSGRGIVVKATVPILREIILIESY